MCIGPKSWLLKCDMTFIWALCYYQPKSTYIRTHFPCFDRLTKENIFLHLPCYLTQYIHVKTYNRTMLDHLNKTSAALFMITYTMPHILWILIYPPYTSWSSWYIFSHRKCFNILQNVNIGCIKIECRIFQKKSRCEFILT